MKPSTTPFSTPSDRWISIPYSSKYFGLKKGIVTYTLVANHIPVNAKMIGADEHESHYVFDVLYNNTTEVQPTIHSTDTHGTNEVNFAILHFFGYQFAPRYRDIADKVRTSLYGFQHPSQYEDLVLKPIRKINEGLIVDEWENMQRILVSLALKTTTQSIIIGKLSAYAVKTRPNEPCGNTTISFVVSICLTTLIRFPCAATFSGHSIGAKAITNYDERYLNFGKLRFTIEQEQQLWNECSRLITNCIILYNATILSRLLLLKEGAGDIQSVVTLKQVSPVAWQHINFYGHYEFTKGCVSFQLRGRK